MAYKEQRMQAGGWGGGYHMPPVTTGHLALTPQKLDSLQGTENAGWGLGGGTVGVGEWGGMGCHMMYKTT